MRLLRYWKCAVKSGCKDEQQQCGHGALDNDGDSSCTGNHAQMEMLTEHPCWKIQRTLLHMKRFCDVITSVVRAKEGAKQADVAVYEIIHQFTARFAIVKLKRARNAELWTRSQSLVLKKSLE